MSDVSKPRLLGLDIVRALAILCVLISHSRAVLPNPEATLVLSFGGKFGVELFFVLSGFLIGSILLKLCDIGLSAKAIRLFWMRRWLRTVPAYLFALLFMMGVSGDYDWRYFFFLQGVVEPNVDLFPVTWSLASEEWFYLLFPLCCLLALKRSPIRGFLWAALGLLYVPLLWQLGQHELCSHSENILRCQDDLVRKFTFRFSTIAMGALLAYAQNRLDLRRLFARHIPALGVITLIVFAAVLFFSLSVILAEGNVATLSSFFLLPLMGLASVFLITLFMVWEPKLPIFLTKAITFISLTSYSNYLWHHWWVGVLHDASPERDGVLLVVYLAGAFLIATLSYLLVERPFLRLRDRMTLAAPAHKG